MLLIEKIYYILLVRMRNAIIEYRTVFAPLVNLMHTDGNWPKATLDELIAEARALAWAMDRAMDRAMARIEAENKAIAKYNETKDDATITLMYKAKAAEAEEAEARRAESAAM